MTETKTVETESTPKRHFKINPRIVVVVAAGITAIITAVALQRELKNTLDEDTDTQSVEA